VALRSDDRSRGLRARAGIRAGGAGVTASARWLHLNESIDNRSMIDVYCWREPSLSERRTGVIADVEGRASRLAVGRAARRARRPWARIGGVRRRVPQRLIERGPGDLGGLDNRLALDISCGHGTPPAELFRARGADRRSVARLRDRAARPPAVRRAGADLDGNAVRAAGTRALRVAGDRR
jgi:hypothetical protein